MEKKLGHDEREDTARLGKAERDIVALGIAIAACILFVVTGGSVLPKIVASWMGVGHTPDLLLTNAVLLNIALLIFGWRRYSELHREVTERRRAEQLARELAERDPLTGCLNRRSGSPAIDALVTAAHARGKAVAVLMADLDNFKQINDLNGHQMGDAVLSAMARRLTAGLPEGSLIARIGGDEFVSAFEYTPGEDEAIEVLAAKLIASVSAPIEDSGSRVQATVSFGISSSADITPGEEQLTSETLIHRADVAMYQAKSHGRNRYFWFEPQMEEALRQRNELERGIRLGIQAGEFVPYYEQQVDLQTGELVGFEMLARWHSPTLGLIGPEVFIPIAEDIDLIADLSENLIRQALQDAKEWDSSLTLAVNISPVQLRDPWFAQRLLQMLSEAGFPPQRMEIEITESCVHENIHGVRAIVQSLKNQGMRISLDDFGTGYSSISQLRSLPFDRLKVDRSFVAELSSDGANLELVQAIIGLGKGLALPITAEGVESHKILEALLGMGQLKGQGYFYGKPEDAATTRDRLERMQLLRTENQTLVIEAPEDADLPLDTSPARKAG